MYGQAMSIKYKIQLFLFPYKMCRQFQLLMLFKHLLFYIWVTSVECLSINHVFSFLLLASKKRREFHYAELKIFELECSGSTRLWACPAIASLNITPLKWICVSLDASLWMVWIKTQLTNTCTSPSGYSIYLTKMNMTFFEWLLTG